LDKENPPPFEVAKVTEMLKNVKSLSDLGKWVSGLVSPIFSSAIIDATDYVNRTLVVDKVRTLVVDKVLS
jgi:hypothetical protein